MYCATFKKFNLQKVVLINLLQLATISRVPFVPKLRLAAFLPKQQHSLDFCAHQHKQFEREKQISIIIWYQNRKLDLSYTSQVEQS